MEQSQRDAVFGYVRHNYNGLYPDDVTDIIFKFYLITIDSTILKGNEQLSLYNLLCDRLGIIQRNVNIKLLYRASENEYKSQIFHKKCDKKGATFCVVLTEYGYVCGGYANISWDLDANYSEDDPHSFLFAVRPQLQLFELHETEKDGVDVIWNDASFGPVFGRGNDFCICNNCALSNGCYIKSVSYQFKKEQLCGKDVSSFSVKDYEVFSVDITQIA